MANFNGHRAKFRRRYLDSLWTKTARGTDFASPRVFWKELWPEYNRVSLWLLDENAFFHDATSLAKTAKTKQELRGMLEKKRDERIEELREILRNVDDALWLGGHKLECRPAVSAGRKISRSQSFDSYIQYIAGSILGWPDCAVIPYVKPGRKCHDYKLSQSDTDYPAPSIGPLLHDTDLPSEFEASPRPPSPEECPDNENQASSSAAITEHTAPDCDGTQSRHDSKEEVSQPVTMNDEPICASESSIHGDILRAQSTECLRKFDKRKHVDELGNENVNTSDSRHPKRVRMADGGFGENRPRKKRSYRPWRYTTAPMQCGSVFPSSVLPGYSYAVPEKVSSTVCGLVWTEPQGPANFASTGASEFVEELIEPENAAE